MGIGAMLTQFSQTYLEPTLYENRFIEVDLWTFGHLFLFILIRKFTKFPFRFIFIGALTFELLEFILAQSTPFFDESLKDTFTDLIVDMIGVVIGMLI